MAGAIDFTIFAGLASSWEAGRRPHLAKTGRRYKLYAADTGVSYHYFFEARRSVVRPEGQGPGSDYTFVIIADQGWPFTVKVFVAARALRLWRQAHGRSLDPN